MSKKRSAGDRRKPIQWVKFVGGNAEQWKKTLSQITIEKIPFTYVNDLRFHCSDGKIHQHELLTSDESYIESIIEKILNEISDVTAIEYVVDLDKLNSDIMTQVKILIKGSKDD